MLTAAALATRNPISKTHDERMDLAAIVTIELLLSCLAKQIAKEIWWEEGEERRTEDSRKKSPGKKVTAY